MTEPTEPTEPTELTDPPTEPPPEPPADPSDEPAPAAGPPDSVTVLYDAEGAAHYMATGSAAHLHGLADGTFTEQPPATGGEPDAAPGQAGDARESGTDLNRSGDQAEGAGTAGGEDRGSRPGKPKAGR